MARTCRFLLPLALFATLTAGQCNMDTPAPVPPANSWLVILCRASDIAAEPHPPAYYEALFKPGAEGVLHDYFSKVSGGTVDISGSQVYGWFPMNVGSAELDAAVRNNSKPVNRSQTAKDCRDAALPSLALKSVDPARFVGTITVINMDLDVGAAGKSFVLSNSGAENAAGFMQHEMLHVLGLNHSLLMDADAGPDHVWASPGGAEYSDRWDIMSDGGGHRTPSPRGPSGPELSGPFLRQLGWLPAGRMKTVTSSETVTLAPISDPAKPGFLMAAVEVPGRSGYYAVEYREPSRFDAGIPRPTVLIREARRNTTYLVQRQNGALDWQQGEMFTDPDNFISIRVDAITPGAATVTINTLYSPGTASADGLCGSKWRGEVSACPATLECKPRRNGQIQSVDWYCLP